MSVVVESELTETVSPSVPPISNAAEPTETEADAVETDTVDSDATTDDVVSADVVDAEGAGQMFRVSTLDMVNAPRLPDGSVDYSRDFFGKETFLTVSGQLNVEAYALSMSKVYTFGPTFRAEQSHTTRHLAEFWMVEPEIAFADLAELASVSEDFLKYLFRAVLNERADDMAFIAERVEKDAVDRLERFVNAPFERIEYSDAIELLKKADQSFEFPVEWGLDLQTEHERWLTEQHVGRPQVRVQVPEEGGRHAGEAGVEPHLGLGAGLGEEAQDRIDAQAHRVDVPGGDGEAHGVRLA